MNQHFNHEQTAAALLEMLSPKQQHHLAECDQCQAEVNNASAQIAELKLHAHSAAERPEEFWTRQRLGIAYQNDSRLRRRDLRWMWAVATATVLAIAIWTGVGLRHPQPPSRQTAAQRTQPAESENARLTSDDALLTNVQLALNRDVPAALAPGEVLTQELRQDIPSSTSRSKIRRNKQ